MINWLPFFLSVVIPLSSMAQAPAETTPPVKTGASDELRELQIEIKNKPDEKVRLNLVDGFLNKYLVLKENWNSSANDYPMDALVGLVKVRQTVCRKDVRDCVDVTLLKEGLCSDKGDNPAVEDLKKRIWTSIFVNIGAEAQAKAMVGTIKNCSAGRTSGKLLAGLTFAAHADARAWYGLNNQVMEWILAEWKNPPAELEYALSLVTDMIVETYSESGPPKSSMYPMMYISRLCKLTKDWSGTPQFEKISPRVVGKWIAMMDRFVILVGDGFMLEEFFLTHKKFLVDKNIDNFIANTSALCSIWLSHNKFQQCRREMDLLKEFVPNSDSSKYAFQIGSIQTELDRISGAPDKAMAVMARLEKAMGKSPSKVISARYYLLLASVELDLGHADKAYEAIKKNMKLSKEAADEMKLDQYNGVSVAVAALIDLKKFDEAQSESDALMKVLAKDVRGGAGLAPWANLDRLFLSLKKETPGVDEIYKKTKELSQAKYFEFVGPVSDALYEASKGRDSSKSIADAKKLIGENHPDIKKIERWIALLEPPRAK